MAGVKGRSGGARPGAGRKPKAVERAAHHCCRSCAKRVAALHHKIVALERLLLKAFALAEQKPAPLPAREIAAVKLMREVAALVPAYLPADIREEVAQAITVDVLARKLARKRLDGQTVRRYVSAAYGLRGLRFRSLDAPAGSDDGRTLGELLVA